MINQVEQSIQKQYVPERAVVVDVGANHGEWTQSLLELKPDASVHLFEPHRPAFEALCTRFCEQIAAGKFACSPQAVGARQQSRSFYAYGENDKFNTMYRRVGVESSLKLAPPSQCEVPVTSLDEYCLANNIRHLNFVKVDVEGAEYDVVCGCSNLLGCRAIDCLQFEYGGTYQDAGVTLEQVMSPLANAGYLFLKLDNDAGITPVDGYSAELEDYRYSNYLAVASRLRHQVTGQKPAMYDYAELFKKYSIAPRGVLHVGAHLGEEYANYKAAGVDRVLFVEADPAVCSELSARFRGHADVDVIAGLAWDQVESVRFNRATFSQSSSALEFAVHGNLYPGIRMKESIEVAGWPLPRLLADHAIQPHDYNVLAVDVQGTEDRVLTGIGDALVQFDAIVTEISYDEVYAGCPRVWDIDDILAPYGFVRMEEVTPFHSTWGDAVYLKSKADDLD